jgi:hypothetical protein
LNIRRKSQNAQTEHASSIIDQIAQPHSEVSLFFKVPRRPSIHFVGLYMIQGFLFKVPRHRKRIEVRLYMIRGFKGTNQLEVVWKKLSIKINAWSHYAVWKVHV